MTIKTAGFFIVGVVLFSCATKKSIPSLAGKAVVSQASSKVLLNAPEIMILEHKNRDALPVELAAVNDSTFVNLKDYSPDFMYDMKYASADNFLKSKVYDCAECYLRYKTVKALVDANQKFMKKGYRIKLFDCYRPVDIQKKMWAIVSNPEYVADPKKGSIHNRGGAVDITLVDENGKELDMGTPFDFFGEAASHDYENLPDEVKKNRRLLRNIMTHNDFRIFESEWWHYNLKNSRKDPLSNVKWKCE
ncbi:peptidase M15 [Flavobacterium psychrotolerans]|uniref:D-alanyl-D-alanine dipeptidase n=2 Tax=Flavobacterium psychrotolerans TaxID=2169410 RepID=A0A2U1JGJ6_9FLAO|nr:peptidase M15 [Flavobacterium psychrotolerans]